MTEDIKDDIEIEVTLPPEDAKKPDDIPGLEAVKAPEEPVIVKAEEKPAVKSPQEGIEELRAKLEAEQRARYAAEQKAIQAAQVAQKATTEVEDTNLHLVNSAIDTVKRESSLLKRQYAEALAAQDYNQVAEVQEAMSGIAVKLSQLEAGKAAMENRPKPAAIEPMPRSRDPIEEIASQVTPASASWLREHKASLPDERAIRRMFRAHEDSVDEGITPDTPEYFRFIENRLGINSKADEVVVDVSTPAPTPKRAPAPASAPVSRSGTLNGARPNTVTLSKDEREMAAAMGMSDKEYAVNKLSLQRAGKLSH